MPPLYQRALGQAFDRLPPILRAFHTDETGGEAAGTLRIEHGKGFLPHLAARLMRLPPPGENIPIHLQIRVDGPREQWIRHYGSHCMRTWQWVQNGLLIEAAGPCRFGFLLSVEDDRMRFTFVRSWLGGLPLPRFLEVRIHATATARETSWWVDVRIESAPLGLLAHYEGEVTPA